MKKGLWFLLSIWLLFCICNIASATAIHYNFSGTVNSISGPDYQPGYAGDTFTGSLVYEYIPDLLPMNEDYYPFTGSYILELNGFTIQTGTSSFRITTLAPTPNPEFLWMYDENPTCNPFGVDTCTVDGFSISLNTLLSTGFVNIEGGGDGWINTFNMSGTINSIDVSPVPEPSSLLTFFIGIIGVSAMIRKNP